MRRGRRMKINKASDLSSISVFPPPPPLHYSRRQNTAPSGLHASQQRSQQSQPSFSQGLSSQHGTLSHLSQNSLDEGLTNDQRVGSQELENSLRKISSFPRLTYSREESQPLNSKSSSNLMIKWNPADHKSQLSEGLEHRIGMMETSLSRFAMILDSIQSDVMQVNKLTKEVVLEMECIRQKLITQDNSLQLMTNGQEEIKASIDGSLKSLAEQISKVTNQEELQEVHLVASALPQLIKASLQSLQNDLHNTTTEMQEISCSLKSLGQKDLAQSALSTKNICSQFIRQKKRQPPANETTMSLLDTVVPNIETGGWKHVKKERATFSGRISEKCKHKEPAVGKNVRGGRDCTIVIESDEETNEGFSCLVEEYTEIIRMVTSRWSYIGMSVHENSSRKRISNDYLNRNNNCSRMCFLGEDLLRNLTKEEEEETKRILQKARKRKRKSCNAINIL